MIRAISWMILLAATSGLAAGPEGPNPEGGRAKDERFHYLRDQALAMPPPQTDARSLSGDYLGQPLPGEIPQVFASGIVSDNAQQHGAPTFSPDGNEVFWQTNRRDKKSKWLISGMSMRRVGGKWTGPEISPYDRRPIFSPDGRRLYFLPIGKADGPCFVEKQGNGWSEPKCVGLVARFPELRAVSQHSIARNGTLYFLGYAAGLKNDSGIYRAELINGKYAKPELLPRSINLPSFLNWTPFIAPDESYLLFSSNRAGDLDLYVSRRRADGTWTEPVSLGEPVNTRRIERFPIVSPEGRYLFFTRWVSDDNEDVFWVSTATIPAMRFTTNLLKENLK